MPVNAGAWGCRITDAVTRLRARRSIEKSAIVHKMSRKMSSSSRAFSPVLEQELENDEVLVGTFHFGGTCVCLRHNYAGQRLSEGAVVERCEIAQENQFGRDEKHALACLKPGTASHERRRSKFNFNFVQQYIHINWLILTG